MSTKVEQTGEFQVVDENGDVRTVVELTTFTEHRPLAGAARWLPGRKQYLLDDAHCNRLKDGSFELVDTGEQLRLA